MASWAHHAKTISLKSVDMVRAAISAVHKIPHSATFVLQEPTHVLYYRTTQRYKNVTNGTIDREKEGLWLIVGANNIHRMRVVRSWARRRILLAIVQQLKAQGFDPNGKKLKSAKDRIIHDGHEIESLVGLADVYVQEKSIGYTYDEVSRQAGILVREILTRCGKRKGSSSSLKPTITKRGRQR